MLLAVFSNFLTIISLFGYALIYKKEDIFIVGNRVHDFSKIKKIGTFDYVDVYYNYWQCADYPGVCVNIPKKQYKISKKFSYTFFENGLIVK